MVGFAMDCVTPKELLCDSASPWCFMLTWSPAQQQPLHPELSLSWALIIFASPETVRPHASILQSSTGSPGQFAHKAMNCAPEDDKSDYHIVLCCFFHGIRPWAQPGQP